MRKGRVAVLRLHRSVALLSGALLLLVSASGAVLIFRPELEDATFGRPARVEIGGAPAPLQALLDAGHARHPDLQPRALVLPEAVGRPARLRLLAPAGESVEILVDPSSGRALNSRWLERSPLHALHVLHTELYLGRRGRLLVAALGGLLVLQAATGLFLWWPFMRRLPRGFTVRRDRRWRVVGYDLHKVIGVTSLAFNVPIALTGALLALSAGEGREGSGAPSPAADQGKLTLDQIAGRAAAVLPPSPVASVRMLPDAVEVRQRDGSTARVDRASGTVIVVSDARQPRERLWALVPPLHEGRLGGLGWRWLYVAGGLTPVALALTGLGIWLGRPRARPFEPLPPPSSQPGGGEGGKGG